MNPQEIMLMMETIKLSASVLADTNIKQEAFLKEVEAMGIKAASLVTTQLTEGKAKQLGIVM